jgi:hypothetical protein
MLSCARPACSGLRVRRLGSPDAPRSRSPARSCASASRSQGACRDEQRMCTALAKGRGRNPARRCAPGRGALRPAGRGGEPRQGSAAWVARCFCRIADCVPAAECLRCSGHTRCRAQVRGLWAVACCSRGASCRLARDFSMAQEWRTWVGCWRCSSSRRAVATQVGRAGRPLARARKLQWALGRRVPGPCRRAAVAYRLSYC